MTEKEFNDKFDEILDEFNKHAFSPEVITQYTDKMADTFNKAKDFDHKVGALTSFIQIYCTDYSSELIRTMLKKFIVDKN